MKTYFFSYWMLVTGFHCLNVYIFMQSRNEQLNITFVHLAKGSSDDNKLFFLEYGIA